MGLDQTSRSTQSHHGAPLTTVTLMFLGRLMLTGRMFLPIRVQNLFGYLNEGNVIRFLKVLYSRP